MGKPSRSIVRFVLGQLFHEDLFHAKPVLAHGEHLYAKTVRLHGIAHLGERAELLDRPTAGFFRKYELSVAIL